MGNPYATGRRARENRKAKADALAAFIADTRIPLEQLFVQPGEDADAELARDRRRRDVERAAGVRVCSDATWTVVRVILGRQR